MWSLRPTLQFLQAAAATAAVTFCAAPAVAQDKSQPTQLGSSQSAEPADAQSADAKSADAKPADAKPAKPPKPYGGGTPLDVILSTRLWTTPPEPKDFVKETRPPDNTLNYQPTGLAADPPRPPTRSKQQLQDLRQELENAGAHNEQAAGVRTNNFPAAKAPVVPKLVHAKTARAVKPVHAKTAAQKTTAAKTN